MEHSYWLTFLFARFNSKWCLILSTNEIHLQKEWCFVSAVAFQKILCQLLKSIQREELPKRFASLKWVISFLSFRFWNGQYPFMCIYTLFFFLIHPYICCRVSCIHLNNRELGEFPITSFIIRKHQIACISSHFITGAL